MPQTTPHHLLRCKARSLRSTIILQVIDLISLKPFDMEAITNSVHKTKRVIIVEECMKTGGIGASLSATINESCFDHLDHQVRRRGWSVCGCWKVTRWSECLLWRAHMPCLLRPAECQNQTHMHCCVAAGGAAQLPGCTNSVCVRAGGSHHCTARAGESCLHL